MTIKTKIRHLVRKVNHLRLHSPRPGKYSLVVDSGIRLLLREPKGLKKQSRIVARGLIAIEQYLLNELAELEHAMTGGHEIREKELDNSKGERLWNT